MIDYSLYGLNEKDIETYREQIYNLLGKGVIQVLSANKPISKQSILAYLIEEIETQPDDYRQKLHRAAIEVIGVTGR
ncbi:biofilm development regulator YmgB/AriR family protein [Pseudomonas lundensis]|uniref:biofilm development regulator YmgB/AriR family protein n=1 Tax=Serratia proteamaculans TaxID=28151 RepID=UPI002980A702|nr:biofilm development regulator YmgB/AriR family protein [Serratia proteamaculans]MDW5499712.1 biofilm development regulator YmgB/AriR family protein [Serratia proteamaculans]MDW5504774.1 biofilm development regulator YmgB/AriR family protein [Pseudomonas lundensis]